MDYAQKLERRKEYHKQKYGVEKAQREKIRQFAAENPERFRELVTKVQAEQARVEQVREAREATLESPGTLANIQRIEALVREIHSGKKDYIIRAKDEWGDEHTLFLGFPISHVPQPGEKVKTPIKGTKYTVIEAIPCTCPLCA